jgi:two-component system sensor histidine kinase KdpD
MMYIKNYKGLTFGFKNIQPWLMRSRQYLISFLVMSLAAFFCFELAQVLGYYIVAFILLILVSILATFLKTGPVLLASLLSMLIWNFFYIPPHHTFHIEKTEDILMFGMFGLVVIMNGVYTTRLKRQEKLTRERETHTNALFQLTRELSKTSGIDEVIKISTREIKNHFNLDSFIIPQDNSNELLPSDQIEISGTFDADQYRNAAWVFNKKKKAGRFTDDFSSDEYTYYPLQGTLINPGVVVLKPLEMFSANEGVFWDSFLAQISNALEREFLAELARKARFLDESDRFYKTLFNSVSHELRIPVATILAASDALIGSSNEGGMHTALANEIYTASLRLNRLIENLLNMSRLESGRIAVRLDWYDMNDLVNKVINDLKVELKAFSLKVTLPESLPLVRIDFGLMEQVIYNLIYNSCQYAPATSEISIVADYTAGNLILKVMDKGPGFPPEAIDTVFNKFYRADVRGTGGLGLGLSIVKGFTEAHKGTVVAENRPGGGAVVTVSIPSEVPDMRDISIEKGDD